MSTSPTRVVAGFYLAISLVVTYILVGSPLALSAVGLAEAPLLVLLGLHYLWGVILLLGSVEYRTLRSGAVRRLVFVPEVLGVFGLLLFLFSFIFALNANMDYVQRFISGGGNLRLALDTRAERLLVWVRIFPFVALNLGVYLFLRLGRYRIVARAVARRNGAVERIVGPWNLLLVLASAFLITVSQPSFLVTDGIPALGWVALVPLFLVLRSSRFGHAVFYGIAFGALSTLMTSYWLGTFNLVSLLIAVAFFLIYWALFTPVALIVYRIAGRARPLVFPLALVLFEYLRSIGFLGYPWALVAHTQYRNLPLIQLATITGVWGVSFLVLMGNSAVAELFGAIVDRHAARRRPVPVRPTAALYSVRNRFGWLVATAALVAAVVLAGTLVLAASAVSDAPYRTVRIAQIQQNNDPRKSDYEQTFATLRRLTDSTMALRPDLIAWSETAFVPNIRHWSTNTSVRRFRLLVTEFLDYQRELGTWLLTGNDDYELVLDEQGREIDRINYNSAILFDDAGVRRSTYRKIRLVPFTEHFPYRERLPWVYDLLLEFDVNFWGQGTEQTVFEHPVVRFSTPICYEDVFPDYVRGFVRNGAELLLNLSNDYWSLAEVQAQQHFVAGLFRTVENRRPLVRTTASGLTGYIDEYGRIVATTPQFQEATLVSDVRIMESQPFTLYTRWGDYFPLVAAAALVVIAMGAMAARPRSGSRLARRSVDVRPKGAKTKGPRTRDVKAGTRTGKRGPKLNWRAMWDE